MATKNDRHNVMSDITSGESLISVQAGAYVIPPERLPQAIARYESMVAFIEELETLDIGTEAPAFVFDPSWEDR